MESVTNGALIEITAEENEERALEALEAAVADLASTMKDLRRATDRFGASLSTAVSKTKQISSSMVELRNSLHSLEQTTTRLVNPSLPVAPSTLASHHRHVPLPVIPSITGSIPPSSSSPSTMASHPSVSLPAISSITESLPPSVGFSTTKLLRTSFTESLPVLTRIEKPEPQLSPDFQFEELHTTASRQKLPIKCFNPIRVFITMDWRVPIASSSLTNPPHCKMPYLDDREGVQAESATGVASLQTSFGAMWQIAWADSYGRNGEHCSLFSWACQCAPGVAIIPVVRCFYIYGVLLFWVSVFLRIISAQNWWCLHEEYPFLYIMVLSLKAKSRRYFPDFGGISCEPCAYTKTTLERGQLKLTTAYGFGGSSMTSIDRVWGDDRLKVSRLEGFVSNREQSYEDPIEELLYAVFGVVSENATVAKLAATSQADLSQLQAAASFACQLEWAVKLIDPASVLQDSNVHGSLNINLSDDEDGSQASVSSANMSTEGNSVQQDYSGMENILYLGGPNIAFQIYNKECANVRIRGAENWGSPLANFLRQPHFIVWNNSDLITHEVMGGLKNAYATGAGTVAAFTNESATSKSDYFDHCTSDMIFITHLVAEDPAKLARPLLADTYVTLLKGRNAGYGQRLAKGELNLGMDDCINGKGQGMIQGIYEEGCNQMCLGPFTSTPSGSPCGCVLPMKVRLLLSVAVYALFPEVNELEIEVATGTYLKHSQLKIVGATANSQNQERPIVGLNLVSLGENFDNTTATLIFERLLRKEVPLNTTLFGIYEVIYIKYPGILSSLPSGGYIGRGPSGSFGTRTQATKNDFDALIGGVADSSAQEAVKRIIEMADRAAMRKEVLHTDLITPLILKESMLVMKKIGDAKVIARGGYPQAERCRRSVGHPEATIDVSDVVAAFSVAGNFVFQPFYHGIFLGSLLGTGIAREKLRAIIVLGKKGAQVLMVFELADFVIESLYNVGNFSVSCTMIPPRTKTFKTVETSPRIEALASASVKSSRSKIVAMIGKGDVKSDVYSCSVAWVEMRGNEWSFDKCKRQWDPGKYCVALDPDTL